MHRPNEERNARFQAFRKSRPALQDTDIATYLGRSRKTIQMWNLGYPGSIPMDTLRLLELAYPTKTDADSDLIG